MTLKKDSMEFNFILDNLKQLCNEVHQVVLTKNKMFKSVGIQLIQSDLSNKTKSKMLKNPTLNLEELEKKCRTVAKRGLRRTKNPIKTSRG